MEPIEEKKDQEKQTESLLDRINKVKRILLDYRRNYPDDFRELKTQLDLLDNGYGVELSKIPNSLLQGTLQVCFNLLELPETPRGYFWNEEDYNDCGVFDVLGDCFAENVEEVEASLRPPPKAVADENALDLEEVEEEEEDVAMGPERPPPPVMVGPSIPDAIKELMDQGIPVQIEEEDDDEVGPALPQQEQRKPTAEALEQVSQLSAAMKGDAAPKHTERQRWMTMMPKDPISAAFATGRPRRFANVPAGCAMDPSWTETPEEREQRRREHLAKTLVGGYVEERLTKEEEAKKQAELEKYFEEYEREHRSESLGEIHKRLKAEKKEQGEDVYSRDAIFRNSRKRSRGNPSSFQYNSSGSLKSRFGTVTYKAGSS
ncbi:hypothetical protein WA577_005162 [Blastocystis sp. JDR]